MSCKVVVKLGLTDSIIEESLASPTMKPTVASPKRVAATAIVVLPIK